MAVNPVSAPNAPVAVAPVVSQSNSKANQVRMAQRHARPASTLTGSMVLAGFTPKVVRKAGSKAEAAVKGLYIEANIGRTVGSLLSENPAWRLHLVWDYQHGHADFIGE